MAQNHNLLPSDLMALMKVSANEGVASRVYK